MRLDTVLRAHAFMKPQSPPLMWDADTDAATVTMLIADLVGFASKEGVRPDQLILNISNVVVAPSDDGEAGGSPEPGEYVALTVNGRVDFGADDRWTPTDRPRGDLLNSLGDRLTAVGARFAYVRRIPPDGSITVFLRRAASPQDPAPHEP